VLVFSTFIYFRIYDANILVVGAMPIDIEVPYLP